MATALKTNCHDASCGGAKPKMNFRQQVRASGRGAMVLLG